MRRALYACVWVFVSLVLLLGWPPAGTSSAPRRPEPAPPPVAESVASTEPLAWARAAVARLPGSPLGPGECVPVAQLGCGDQAYVDTINSPYNSIETYFWGGSFYFERGPEDAYSFEAELFEQVTLKLSNMTSDLDLFVLAPVDGGCQASGCIAAGDSEVTFMAEGAGLRYYFVVDSPESEGGQGLLSVICPPPERPTNIRASDGTYSDHIRVSWDLSPLADYYQVYRSTLPHSAYWLHNTGAYYTDDYGVDLGETYYYWVSACSDERGCSELSESDTGYLRCDPMSPPSNVQASDGTYADRVRVTWEYPATSHELHFELHRATSSGGAKTKLYEGVDKSYDDASANLGTTYYYWVTTCDVCGCGNFSSHNTGYRRCDPPTVPGNVQASDDAYADKVRVTWNSVSGADDYEVYRATSAGGTKARLASRSGTSYDDTTATPGQTYYYWVKACSDACDCGDFSSYDTGRRACPTPAAPANVQASDAAYTDKVRVTWDGVPGADDYEVYRATSAGGTKTMLGTASGMSYDDTTASPGTIYHYWVSACSDTCGCGDFSNSDTGVRSGSCPVLPAPPGNVQATDGTYPDKVQVSWGAVSAVDGYEIYRAGSAAGAKSTLGSTSGMSYDDTTAVPGTTYHYWVASCTGACGCGNYSAGDSGYRLVTCSDPPHMPSNPSPDDWATEVSTATGLSWSGGHPCAGEAVRYDVYLEMGDRTPDVQVCSDVAVPFCDPGSLETGTYYYWQVSAKGLNGPRLGPVWGFETTEHTLRPQVYLPLVVR